MALQNYQNIPIALKLTFIELRVILLGCLALTADTNPLATLLGQEPNKIMYLRENFALEMHPISVNCVF
jgi:hypothetical protein